ncbi:MAG: cation:proton antiporter [Spirochaetes bacterium]|nr:MAG: cation:proton antiporter [Spirochaetota bacterium]
MGAESLLVIGAALIFGVIGARLFKAVKIPQVVGYIIIGIALGVSGADIITKDLIQKFAPLNYLALGIIGFLVGGELKKSVFKKFGKSMIIILVMEGMLAFIIVSLLIGIYTKNWGLAIVLGALASATAPAATVDVLWEYKSAGVLTTMVFAIVALDDGLALLLYGFANAIARILIAHKGFSIMSAIIKPLYEIGGSAALGIGIAFIYRYLLDITGRYRHEKDLMLSFTFGSIVLIIALSLKFGFDLILAEMFFGVTFVNIAPHYSQRVFELMKGFSPPIYILFFVLAGARLEVTSVTVITLVTALLYLVGRTSGKMLGASIGARVSRSPKKVSKYLGFCLFSQAGVTIGLAISTFHTFPELGITIINVVTLTTFLVQIIGPPFVKFAITKADEAGKNITEDEMLEKYKVEYAMDKNPSVIRIGDNLDFVINTISSNKYDDIPVINNNNEIVGVISLSQIKPLLNINIPRSAIIAEDVMTPVKYIITGSKSLLEAYRIMKNYNVNYLPVVSEKNSKKLVGFLSIEHINSIIREETIKLKEALG